MLKPYPDAVLSSTAFNQNSCFGPPRTSHRSGCRTDRPGCARAHAFEQVAFAGVSRRRAGAKQHSGSFASTNLILTSRHCNEGGVNVIIRTLQQILETTKVLCEGVIRALGCSKMITSNYIMLMHTGGNNRISVDQPAPAATPVKQGPISVASVLVHCAHL